MTTLPPDDQIEFIAADLATRTSEFLLVTHDDPTKFAIVVGDTTIVLDRRLAPMLCAGLSEVFDNLNDYPVDPDSERAMVCDAWAERWDDDEG